MGENFEIMDCVWAKTSTLYWPAVIVSESDVLLKKSQEDSFLVFWLGDHRVSEVIRKNVIHFSANFCRIYNHQVNKMGKMWTDGLLEAIKAIYSEESKKVQRESDILDWAYQTFLYKQTDCKLKVIPKAMEEYINKEKGIIWSHFNTSKRSDLLKKAISNDDSLDSICAACFVYRPSYNHPIIEGKSCLNCLVKLKKTIYIMDKSSGFYEFCFICGNKQNMLNCTAINCSRSFCYACVKYNFNYKEDVGNFVCIVCNPRQFEKTLFPLKQDFIYNLQQLLSTNIKISKYQSIMRNLNLVMSFDGKCEGFKYIFPQSHSLLLPVEENNGDFLGFMGLDHFSFKYNSPVLIRSMVHERKIVTFYERWKDFDFTNTSVDLVIGGNSGGNTKGNISNMLIFFQFYFVYKNIRRTKNMDNILWLLEMPSDLNLEERSIMTRFMSTQPVLITVKEAESKKPESLRIMWTNISAFKL